MSTTEDSDNRDNSSEGPSIFNLVAAAVLLAKYKAAMANVAPVVNSDLPFQATVDGSQSVKRTKVLGQLAYVS